ncbi:MAG TPA: T9SS type A sorting domain-containing protein, partial [Bacteroidia bacterium]|nr:T9SS type A sorting domain-containing protein [Bacteroidia bacterium]
MTGDKTDYCNGSDDYWVVKIDSIGNILWQNTIGGGNDDMLLSMVQSQNGGYVLGGYSTSDISGDKTKNSHGGMDYWLLQLDSLGNIVWQNTIGGDANDLPYSITPSNDGGYILGGTSTSNISGDKTENSNGLSDYWVVKIDSIGNIVWQNTIGGIGTDMLLSITNSLDGGYILGGHSWSSISGDKSENCIGSEDYWVVKIDSVGNILWQNTIGGSESDRFAFVSHAPDAGFILGGWSFSNISGDKTENKKGVCDYWIVKIDSLGNIDWQNTIGGSSIEKLSCATLSLDGGIVLSGNSISNISGDKEENAIGSYDFWILKLSHSSRITGKLFADINQNNIQDNGEANMIGLKITEVNTGRSTFSQSDGKYAIGVHDTGVFVLNPSTQFYYASNPPTHTATFTAIQQIDSLNDFAFQPTIVTNDLLISIHPTTCFRSNFTGMYNVHYKNIGTTTLWPTIYFFNDSNIAFSTSSIAPNNVYADSIIWNLPPIVPYMEYDFTITVGVNIGLQNGTQINSSIKIFPFTNDTDITNNFASWVLQTIGSYDPNEIIVSRDSLDIMELNPVPPFLDYVIYFQNTGNDTAFNVKVENIIPPQLELGSFEYLSSSSPVNISLNSQSRLASFEFPNIQLPDSNIDEPGSHGYIRYRIQPLNTLQVNDSILSTAAIYFDFNAPVITNTAHTIIGMNVLSAQSEIQLTNNFSVMPNPAKNNLTIAFKNQTQANEQLEIISATGKLLKKIKVQPHTTKMEIDISKLPNGFYLLKYNQAERVESIKFVVER